MQSTNLETAQILLTQLKTMAEAIYQQAIVLANSNKQLREIRINYDQALDLAIREHLDANNQNWCTYCKKIVSKTDLKLVYIVRQDKKYDGRERYTLYYTWNTCKQLHSACPHCYTGIKAKHGWYGPYDKVNDGQDSYHAYDACLSNNNDGSFYANEEILDELDPHTINIPRDELAKTLNLPIIKIEYRGKVYSDTKPMDVVINDKPYAITQDFKTN